MRHYFCSGCGSTKEESGFCRTDQCSKYNLPLTLCNCTDGQHINSIKEEDIGMDRP